MLIILLNGVLSKYKLIGAFSTLFIISSCNFLVACHDYINKDPALRYTMKDNRNVDPIIEIV